jgi:hypothetical protein
MQAGVNVSIPDQLVPSCLGNLPVFDLTSGTIQTELCLIMKISAAASIRVRSPLYQYSRVRAGCSPR